jgi:putative transposase
VIDHLRDNGFSGRAFVSGAGLSASAYSARRSRRPSRRDAWLSGQIARVFCDNWRVYGARRITRALRREGIKTCRGRWSG